MMIDLPPPHKLGTRLKSIKLLKRMPEGAKLVLTLYDRPTKLYMRVPFGRLVEFAEIDGLPIAVYVRTK